MQKGKNSYKANNNRYHRVIIIIYLGVVNQPVIGPTCPKMEVACRSQSENLGLSVLLSLPIIFPPSYRMV